MSEIGRFAYEIREMDRPVELLKPGGRFQQLRELAARLRAEKIDVLHTHNTFPHVWGTLAARLAGVRVILQTRHGQRAGHGWKSRVKYRWASYWADRVVAVSDDAARLCIASDGIPKSRVARIWNGIDLAKFPWAGPQPGVIAISVARLSAEKDFPTLLQAAALTAPRVPGFKLQIVGDGAERTKLEAIARDLKLEGIVEFLGERTDVAELLAKASFFVSSSLTEGISLTLLEAMAVGLPIVATAVGGNPEIVVDGETGLLTPSNDPHALAAAMTSLCHAPQRQTAFAQAGRQRVEQHFDVRRMVRDYEALYQQLWQQKR